MHIASIQKARILAFNRWDNEKKTSKSIRLVIPDSFIFNRRIFSDQLSLLKLWAASIVVSYIFFYILTLQPDFYAKIIDCADDTFNLAIVGIYFVYLILFAVMAVLLRNISDNFNIKEEFKYGIISWIVVIVAWVIADFVVPPTGDGNFVGGQVEISVILPVGYVISFLVGTVYQLVKSYEDFSLTDENDPFSTKLLGSAPPSLQGSNNVSPETSRSPSIASSSPPEIMKQIQQKARLERTFSQTLNDEQGFHAFKNFLALEFCVENLVVSTNLKIYLNYLTHFFFFFFWKQFWDQVNKFKEMKEEDLQSQAEHLYNSFIKSDSKFQVNLDNWVVKDIEEAIREKRATRTTFDEAQTFVYELMKTDSYPRSLKKNRAGGNAKMSVSSTFDFVLTNRKQPQQKKQTSLV